MCNAEQVVILSFELCLYFDGIYLPTQDRYPQPRQRAILSLGDYSFGIFFSHVLVILLLRKYSFYNFIPFPINSALVLGIAWTVVYLTAKVLPKSVSRAMGLR